MKAAVASEPDKIAALAAQGVPRYILITNVAGTPHPGKASIDQVQSYRDESARSRRCACGVMTSRHLPGSPAKARRRPGR